MKLSDAGLALIKDFEGYHKALSNGDCEAYRCPAGVWTIGYGCTKGVREGLVWSREKAEAELLRELGGHERAVETLVKVPLTQAQFDALVSFAYNVGDGALGKSTLLKVLNQGRYDLVPSQLMRWTKAGGKVLRGLERRRRAEAEMWRSGGQAVDGDAMPQSVEPVTGSPTAAIKQSWTIRGALLSFLSSLGVVAGDFVGLTADVATQAKQTLDPFQSLLGMVGANIQYLALGGALIGTIIVITRRLDAAKEGKIG